MKKRFFIYSLFFGAILILGGAGCSQKRSEVPIKDDFGNGQQEIKNYVSRDPRQCETLRFTCKEDEEAFFDSVGCGCGKKPSTSVSKEYIGKSPKECTALLFECDLGEKEFFDAAGCGCEKSEEMIPEFCTEEYKPVCGEVEVQCIKAPCPPLKQTFTNRCLANKAKAKNIIESECKGVVSTFLEILSPLEQTIVGNPIEVKGRVLSPWLLENGTAPIEVQDNKGIVLGKGTIKGPADWKTRQSWIDFSVTITFTKPNTPEGFVLFKRGSASSSPEFVQDIKIPIKFSQRGTICPTIYKPVCGEIQPKCITQPCLPLRQTYSNRCTAEAAGVQNIIEGECKGDPRAFIQVSSPQEGTLIANPLIIKGQAKGTWFFEGSFPIEIITKDGKNIGKGIAQAQGEWMTEKFVNFEAKIEFKKPALPEGFIILKKDNPSGDPNMDMELRVPIKFSEVAGVICPAIYKPVCGEVESDCAGLSCPLVKKTFSNRCTAEGVGAKNIVEGQCKNERVITCQVTGCNNEICSDKPMTSICIASPEYGCYRKAQCGVQKDGTCGWVQTEELKKCLEEASKASKPRVQ